VVGLEAITEGSIPNSMINVPPLPCWERAGVRVYDHLFYPPPLNPLPPGEGSSWGLSFSMSIFGGKMDVSLYPSPPRGEGRVRGKLILHKW
jgi:hypothetical protein